MFPGPIQANVRYGDAGGKKGQKKRLRVVPDVPSIRCCLSWRQTDGCRSRQSRTAIQRGNPRPFALRVPRGPSPIRAKTYGSLLGAMLTPRSTGRSSPQDCARMGLESLLRPQGPGPSRQHVRGDQGVGRCVRHDGVGQFSAPIQGDGVEHPSQNPGEPTAVQGPEQG